MSSKEASEQMSIGNSGRIVIEIPSEKKRLLYSELSRRGLSLKGWFLDQVDGYLRSNADSATSGHQSPSKPIHHQVVALSKSKEAAQVKSPKAVMGGAQSVERKLQSTYETLERKYSVRVLSSDVSYVSPVNFVESMRRPRHRWFPYKEGFSPTFVEGFIAEFTKSCGGLVFDPFSGVGTTCLVASKLGFESIGLDVSPMATFIARTKATHLKKLEFAAFSNYIHEIEDSPLTKKSVQPDNATVVSYFEEEYLSALLSIRSMVDDAPSEKISKLALLAFLTLIEEFSTHRKAGNGVKRKTRFEYRKSGEPALEQVRVAFIGKLKEMLADLGMDSLNIEPDFRSASCINSDAIANIGDIDLALTSPPYANCFDYSKIYMRELWLGGFFKSSADQVAFRKSSIRSHVHATWSDRNIGYGSEIAERLICTSLESQELWSNKIPSMISGYFKDMGALLADLKPRMRKGASFGIVVGNSVYGGVSVASDLLIAEMAENIGYEVSRIDVYRGVIPSSQQYALIDDRRWARESTVIVKKK